MITFYEALETVKNATKKLEKEYVDLSDCLNRVLAKNVYSNVNIPPFNQSAVNGYACKKSDLKDNLKIIAHADLTNTSLMHKQCCKIKSGERIPKGADTVVKADNIKKLENGLIHISKEESKSNIFIKGEDIKKENLVLQKGTRLKPHHISVLATVNFTKPMVYKQPKLATLSKINGLREPEQQAKNILSENVNSLQLQAQLLKMGIRKNYHEILTASKENAKKTITKCIKENDILIILENAKNSDYNSLPAILKELGFNIWFHTLAVRPGKHTIFASKDGKYIFAMSGNPASSFIQFELLGKPLLYRLMGHNYNAPMVKMPISLNYKRKNTAQLEFIPIRFNANNQVIPIKYNGSERINSFTHANGIMIVPREVDEFTEGEFVYIRQL